MSLAQLAKFTCTKTPAKLASYSAPFGAICKVVFIAIVFAPVVNSYDVKLHNICTEHSEVVTMTYTTRVIRFFNTPLRGPSMSTGVVVSV